MLLNLGGEKKIVTGNYCCVREEKEEAVSEWTLKLSIDGQLCYRIFIFINPHDVGFD